MDETDLSALIEGEAPAPVAPEPEAIAPEAPAPTTQPPLTEKETVGFFKAMQAEREKRQELEKQLATYRAKETPQAAPEPIQTLEMELYRQKMDMSRGFADQRHGAETMAKVHDWAVARCDADPAFNEQVRQSKDPYGFAKQAFDREQVLEAVKPDELTDYQAWKASRPPGSQAPAPPPRSLANAPKAGGAGAQAETPMGPGAAFASAIRR